MSMTKWLREVISRSMRAAWALIREPRRLGKVVGRVFVTLVVRFILMGIIMAVFGWFNSVQ